MDFMDIVKDFIGVNRSVWIALRIAEKNKHWIDYFQSLGETWEEAVISTAIVIGMSIRRIDG